MFFVDCLLFSVDCFYFLLVVVCCVCCCLFIVHVVWCCMCWLLFVVYCLCCMCWLSFVVFAVVCLVFVCLFVCMRWLSFVGVLSSWWFLAVCQPKHRSKCRPKAPLMTMVTGVCKINGVAIVVNFANTGILMVMLTHNKQAIGQNVVQKHQ